jgi:hypothetical protein
MVLFDGFKRQQQEESKEKKGDTMSVGSQINEYTNLHEQDESQVCLCSRFTFSVTDFLANGELSKICQCLLQRLDSLL